MANHSNELTASPPFVMLKQVTSAVLESHQLVVKIVAAAPLLFLAPVAAEAVQHAIEWSIGFFSLSSSEAHSTARDGRRVLAGLVKVSTFAVTGILVARYWAHRRDLLRAIRLDVRERRFLFGGVVLTAAVLVFLVASPALLSRTELSDKQRRLGPALLVVVAAALLQRRSVWALAGLLGDRAMTTERAAVLSSGRPAWFTMLALIAAIAPTMALHYALNLSARGLGQAPLALLLAFDSLLVGAMAMIAGNIIWITYRDAQTMVGAPLASVDSQV
jgi:hypothetical protein